VHLIYSLFGEKPAFFEPVLDCACLFSKIPVTVLSTMPDDLEALRFQIEAVKNNNLRRMQAYSLLRWIVIYRIVKDWGRDCWPIFFADWDMLICDDLRPMLKMTAAADLCVTKDANGHTSAPYAIQHLEFLRSFCDITLSMIQNSVPALAHLSDMELWQQVAQLCGWKVQSINVVGAEAFDHNLACWDNQFELVPSDLDRADTPYRKKIVYDHGKPHFVYQNGTLVKATVIHFWNGFKPLIFEIASKLKAGSAP